MAAFDDHPEKFENLATAETWWLADDLVDFRFGLLLGAPECDWSQAEAESANLDVYKRFDPVEGWEFSIWRMCPDGVRRCVGRTKRVPGPWLLRELARNSVRNGHDWLAEADRIRQAHLKAAQDDYDAAKAEVDAHAAFALKKEGIL